MKTILAILLVGAFVGLVGALNCKACRDIVLSAGSDCMNNPNSTSVQSQTCSVNETFCYVKVVNVEILGTIVWTRGCADSCTPGGSCRNELGNGNCLRCCTTDNCNIEDPYALNCKTCEATLGADSDCKNNVTAVPSKTCASNEPYCYVQVAPRANVKRGCASECTPAENCKNGTGDCRVCCQTDDCNTPTPDYGNAASVVHVSLTVLIAAALVTITSVM